LNTAAILTLALLLDSLAGEPRWLWSRLPHPAVLMGRLVDMGDQRFNRADHPRLRGTLVLATQVVAAAALGLLIARGVPESWVVQIPLVAILLAQRSLSDHVRAVAFALRRSIAEGRRSVAMIVGRDTAAMDEPAVVRAAIESAAENMSDGVIAPAFWFLVAGLPGILVYKLVNTADSMIGHRTPRHEQFGWAAARLDDGLNLIPARLSALLLWASAPRAGAWRIILRDAPLHRSPNAGWPEAAMATALDTALSGPRSYGGTMRDFPFVHPAGDRNPGPDTILRSSVLLWRAWGLLLIATLALAFWFR
jgi:adenosylcobinamide-phosphate synthase